MSTRMKVVSGVVWGLVALIAIGIWLLPPHIPVSDKVQGADRDMAVKAAVLLLEKCPAIAQHWDDFKKIEADIMPAYWAENMGLAASHGWGRTIRVVAAVKDDPVTIPAGWAAARHNLFFHMGGGSNPGIEATKKQARLFCEVTYATEGKPAIRLDQDFGFIK